MSVLCFVPHLHVKLICMFLHTVLLGLFKKSNKYDSFIQNTTVCVASCFSFTRCFEDEAHKLVAKLKASCGVLATWSHLREHVCWNMIFHMHDLSLPTLMGCFFHHYYVCLLRSGDITHIPSDREQ